MFKKVIKQEGLKDCGPVCLFMIIEHYKGYVELEKLKEMCKTNKFGTTAYHLIEASKKCGFESHGVKCELKDLTKENTILPCIAHVIIDDSYNHYVVIDKIDYKNKKIIIKDPIGKIKHYKYEEFNKIFNNVLIYMYPIKNIIHEEKKSFIKYILKLITPSTSQLKQVIIISLFITIFSIITTFYMQNMIDNIIGGKPKILFIFFIFLLVYILKIISNFFRNKINILINQKIDLNLTYETFKQIIYLPYHYYRNNTTGELISKINDLEIVRQIISKVALSLFIDLPLTIIALITMYFINPSLFFISLIILLLYILILILFRKPFENKIDEAQKLKASAISYMVESINGFESIKGCNLKEKTLNNFEKKYTKLLNQLFKFDKCYNYQYLLKEIINDIGFILIILIGIFLVIDEQLTIGQLITFQILLGYFLEPIRNVIDLDSSIKQAILAIKKVMNLSKREKNQAIINKNLEGDITFKNLSYSFDDIHNILENINLTIKEGNKVMVIGQSGSGKSTLFKMLKKYYPIKRNQIFIDNIDINDYQDSDIVYVSQNEILFTDTFLNNIGNNDIKTVANLCLVDDIVKKSPLGYNTLIEENGFNLSGGEKQRIVLARAINNPFSILVIDEGLSQVDVNMERIILKNLFDKFKDKTIIFISHRLDNMDIFDQVVNLKKGKLKDELSKC